MDLIDMIIETSSPKSMVTYGHLGIFVCFTVLPHTQPFPLLTSVLDFPGGFDAGRFSTTFAAFAFALALALALEGWLWGFP